MNPAPIERVSRRRSPAAVRAGHEGDCVPRRGQAGTAFTALLLLALSAPCGHGQTERAAGRPDHGGGRPAGPARHAGLGRGRLPRLRPRRAGRPQRPGISSSVQPRHGLQFLGLPFRTSLRLRRLHVLGNSAAPGITNPKQGVFDFSKREFDLSGGAAWNYSGPWEARAFAYSFNNLNRGESASAPAGYADGFGLENRYYLSNTYASLGTTDFDAARATFISAGFYPSKTMVDGRGLEFKPGPFVRANLQLDLVGDWCYLYGDGEFLGTRSCTPKQLTLDAGVAVRPWDFSPRLEFRIGTDDSYDLRYHDVERTVYGAVAASSTERATRSAARRG